MAAHFCPSTPCLICRPVDLSQMDDRQRTRYKEALVEWLEMERNRRLHDWTIFPTQELF